jgi:inorganic triphosphatase YgiF
VELELKSGPPEALFRLARRLIAAAPLYLSFEGKAAQGQTLLQGGRLAARRWEAPRLEPEATVAEAFQALGRSCVGLIAANAAVLRRTDEAEAVHQLRVAVRRLRGALSMFAPILGGDAAGPRLSDELKWLASTCDNARNLDVYLAETVRPAADAETAPHGIDALVQCLETARARAHDEVLAAVSSSRFRELLVEVVAWMEMGAWLEGPDTGRPARGFMADALDRLRRKLFKNGLDLAALDDHGRHKVRIHAKRLRYAADGCASLFDAEAVKRFVDRLKAVQDQLGTLNDIVTAEGLVAGLEPDAAGAYAAGHLAGLRAARRPKLIRRGGRALRRLAKVEPFWRG